MKLLKYLLAIIGILHHIEAKAFQTGNVKGAFDHMYENLYLKKAVENSNKNGGQSYKMRYVPHVNGKPIFIPFDEFETLSPPDVLKTRPNQLRHKPDPSRVESTKMYPNFVPQKVSSSNIPNDYEGATKQPLHKEKEYVKSPVGDFLKPIKEGQKRHEDHPVVIDVVTQKIVNTRPSLEDKNYALQEKQPAVKKAVSVQEMNYSNKNFMKQETYEVDSVKEVTKKNTSKVNNSLKVDKSKVSKDELKKNNPYYPVSDSHEKSLKENLPQPFNHEDSPVVLESLTKDDEDYDYPIVIRPFTNKHKVNTVDKINKKPIQDNELKTEKLKPTLNKDTKTPEKKVVESNYNPKIEQKQTFNKEDYDTPVVVGNVMKETIEDYDYPLVIRPFSEKHSGVDKTKVKINKPALYGDSTIPEKKAAKTEYKLQMTKDPKNFLSDVSTDGDENNIEEFTKIKMHQDATETKSKDSSTAENLQKDYSSASDVNLSIDSLSHNSDYEEEYDIDGEYEDYDNPVIVEALVQKTDQKMQNDHDTSANMKDNAVVDYDQPVVVEALVKKTNEKDVKDYDKPVISEALIKKYPVKNSVEQQTAHENKKYPKLGEESDNDNAEAPVIVEALVKKNNKKRVKYSTKMKPPKSSTHSYYEDSSTSKIKKSFEHVDLFHTLDELAIPSKIKNADDAITTDPVFLEQSKIENFSNENAFDAESLGEINDQFDAGSGTIKESIMDDSRSLSSKSNGWPLLNSFHSQERNKFKKCTTPSKEAGNCMPIQMCPTPNLQLTLDDLLKKICAIDEVFIGICCPEFPAETLKVDWENFNNASSDDDNEALEAKPEGCGKIQEFGKDPQSWPWMAPLISVSTRRIFCGGVLIKEQYVLTAAHCTRKIPRNQIVVVLGPSEKDSTPQEFEVVEIKRHAQYNPKTMQNDLALLKLSRKVRRPFICLPDEETFVAKEALMLGWQGSFAASKTEEKLVVISPQECRKAAVKIVVGDNIMCTEPRTEDVMCNVDSGAPLVITLNDSYQVIGLLTWNRNDCDSSFPAIFTRVSHFKRWIENHAI